MERIENHTALRELVTGVGVLRYAGRDARGLRWWLGIADSRGGMRRRRVCVTTRSGLLIWPEAPSHGRGGRPDGTFV